MTLGELFQQAERTGADGGFTRIDERHPVGIFVGLDGGRRCILVVCPEQPPAAPTIGALHVEARRRHDGNWALTIRLERPDLSALFTRLVDDLAGATAADGRHPGSVVVQRLVRWQRLFLPARSDLLEDFELRGLIAELSFLIDEAVPFAGPEAALRAWRGPFDAPKDFVFADREIEVKATSHQPKSLHISSLEQLIPIPSDHAAIAEGWGSEAMAALIQSQPQRRRTRGGSASSASRKAWTSATLSSRVA